MSSVIIFFLSFVSCGQWPVGCERSSGSLSPANRWPLERRKNKKIIELIDSWSSFNSFHSSVVGDLWSVLKHQHPLPTTLRWNERDWSLDHGILLFLYELSVITVWNHLLMAGLGLDRRSAIKRKVVPPWWTARKREREAFLNIIFLKREN